MTQPSYTISRVCEKHLRGVFWANRIWEKYFLYELDIIFKPAKPKRFIDHKGTQVEWSQDLRFTDPANGGKEVARCHWYLDVNIQPAGSGQPDPKDIMLGETNYRIWREGDPPCPLCPFIVRIWARFRQQLQRIFRRGG
jgi:hypothetical protein